MKSPFDAFRSAAQRLSRPKRTIRNRKKSDQGLTFETLQPRQLLATVAITDGAWTDAATWDNGVPDQTQRAIISHGISVELDGSQHDAKEIVVHGDLVVTEDSFDKSLTTNWIHINSGGEFIVGSAADRYDQADFTLTLTGTDKDRTDAYVVETNMGGNNPGTMEIVGNDGFLMTGGMGRVQFFGQEKLSFTKLSASAAPNDTTITVANVIERNFTAGGMNGSDFVTSAIDDGEVDWEIGDQIVIASSSYDYTEEEVRIIEDIDVSADGQEVILTLDSALEFAHYGQKETYGSSAAPGTTAASQTYEIDLRAEVALLSRNIKIQGLESQDTDAEFGDRANVQTEPRVLGAGMDGEDFSDDQVANGVGGHIMFMNDSGQNTVDGVQLDRMGQSSKRGRYPIHWHLGDARSDVLRNSSITNSNNRGVTIHGTSGLLIEDVVLHDVHGHGFFFEDAVEENNVLIGNLALGIHAVGGNDESFANPAGNDVFVVDTHDTFLETNARFSSSAAFWITNPNNVFIGNIAAGAGDSRTESYAEPDKGNAAGTGFWYAIPRGPLGLSATKAQYANMTPIFSEFGQFDYNTSHTTAVGLNFDRGTDIEDSNQTGFDFDGTHYANEYSPRVGGVKSGEKTTNFVNHFTNYKATDAAVYHRGEKESIQFNDLRIADSANGPWAVSENKYNDSLFVGHSKGNADETANVGGPRLYDGAGLYTNTHFAGFEHENAYTFQVEGSSFGPTTYHAFQNTSFENDGTFGNVSHAVSDFDQSPEDGHDLGRPFKWIKGVLDLDGTLTGPHGGAGYSIVPNIDFLIEDGDTQPAGWDAVVTNDIYARIRVENLNNGDDNDKEFFPSDSNGEPVIMFTTREDAANSERETVAVLNGQNNGDQSWTQIAAKTDGDGNVEGTFTIEYGRLGIPKHGFALNMNNQDGGRPQENSTIQQMVDDARIVIKIVGAENYTPEINGQVATEVFNDPDLRSEMDEVVFFRDGLGNLYLNTGISDNQPKIEFTPGADLQTTFANEAPTITYGSIIQAEHFDRGIDGIAYHDSDTTNTLGSFRDDTGVDATEFEIGNIADGEWLEYTTNIVPSAYDIGLNVAATEVGGQIRVRAAISNSAGFLTDLGLINVPNTDGEFQTVWLEAANLFPISTTETVIRLEFIGGGFEVDSIEFAAPDQSSYVPGRTITADLTTSKIELEEFDHGGQGVAYFDDSVGNDENKPDTEEPYRDDEDVDTNKDQLNGRVFDGEWLEYTTDIQGGMYDITLNKKWGGEGSGVRLLIGDSNSATSFDEIGVFDFTSGDEEQITLFDKNLDDYAGKDRVFRIEIIGNWMGLDSIEFVSKTQIAPTADIVDVSPDLRNTSVGDVTIEFDEAVTGVDVGDFSLTRDGNAVDISNLDFTQVSPRRYNIDFSAVTTIGGSYELTLNSAGSGIQDIAGNALVSDAVDQFMIDLAGPQVESVIVNDGSAQRSMISQLTVNFSEEVSGVDANSFVLMNTSTNQQVLPTVTTQIINGKTVATLTFNGSGIVGGSLSDGNYTLTTLATTMTDAAGNQLDGNGDGTDGDNATDSFFRFFGDVNGDRKVNIIDFFQFRDAFRGNYNAAFDFSGDGNVNIIDFFQFRSRFGQSI